MSENISFIQKSIITAKESLVPAIVTSKKWFHHKVIAVANTNTGLRIQKLAQTILSKLYFDNKTIAAYHKYVAGQIQTKITISTPFFQKEFNKDLERSGIKSSPIMSFEEFKEQMELSSKEIPKSIGKGENVTFEEIHQNIVNLFTKININRLHLNGIISSVKHSAKLLGMAGARLGWPIYHLYFQACEFPGRVGTFCINAGKIKEAKSDKDIKSAKNLISKLNQANIEPIDTSKLKGRPIQGVCFGAVLHLFTNYHNENNEKNFINLEKLASYESGVPSEAVANQLVYESMHLSREGKASTESTMTKYQVSIKGKDNNEKIRLVSPFFRHKREQMLFESRGLDLKYCDEFSHVLNRKNDQEIYDNLDKLSPGTYSIGFSMGSGSHAIGYIKHPDGTAHIFDPNKGTIRCYSNPEDHSKQLKKVIDCYQTSTTQGSQKFGKNHEIEICKAVKKSSINLNLH